MTFQNSQSLRLAERLAGRLDTIDSFQTSIRHADAKTTTLLTALAGMAALVAGNVHTVRHAAESGTWPLTALLLAAGTYVLSTLCAAIRLINAFRPRLPDLGSPNRFAFPMWLARLSR